jgi:NitT/TauT family transport system ATP-binding protein
MSDTAAPAPDRTQGRAGADDRPVIEVVGLGMRYGSAESGTTAIGDVSFEVEKHEFVCIVGPSGCGKTTLLKCIAGLLHPTSGHSTVNGRTVDSPPSDLAVVFQDYSRSLFPWLTVRKNVSLPLRRLSSRDRAAAVERALESVGLQRFRDHYPWQLSGGMQQRVAIARALAYRPRVLLMDEPFASVDALTRSELEDLVLRVRTEFEGTVLLVTHDIDEAVYMADRVIILSRPPSTIQEILSIPLPRPRQQIATKQTPEFASYRTKVYRQIVEHGSDSRSTPQ